MTKTNIKISYVTLLMILFGLIAIFLFVRNMLILKNNIEYEAVCYSYESKIDYYKVSYFYKNNDKTYYIIREEKDKPKLASKRKIYCSKDNPSKCIMDKDRYVKGLYISAIVFIPVIVFIALEIRKKGHKYQKWHIIKINILSIKKL